MDGEMLASFLADMKIGCKSGIFDPIEFKVW
jgi:hypothetical protein